MIFIFDVDGTLTPSRQKISKDFEEFFLDFCRSHEVYLVTGSDYQKTLEQLGSEICMTVKRIYNCSGADVWEQGENTYRSEWILPELAHSFLAEWLTESEFDLRTGLHFEHRSGMCNFSIVGRNASLEERKQYAQWDLKTNERQRIAKEFNALFPDLQATVGGEISIDISAKGSDKSQILRDIPADEFVHFFGDKQLPGGNDYPLAKALVARGSSWCYNVENYKQTWDILLGY